MKKRLASAVCGLSVLGLMSPALHARLVQQDVSDNAGTTGPNDAQFNFDGNISNSDLINAGSPALSGVNFVGTTSTGGSGGGTIDKLTDGKASGKTTSAGANDLSGTTFFSSSDLAGNPTVTYTFNGGYNLTKINSIYGWQDTQTFSDQKYDISVETVGSSIFTPLTTIDYTPFRSDVSGTDVPHSSQVTLTNNTTGILASNVNALRFTFHEAGPADGLSQNQSGQVIREIDAFGSPVPEPASLAALGLAAAGMLIRRRR